MADTPAGQNIICGKAQPGKPSNYNTWLEALTGVVPSAYAYAMQDRLGKVLLEFDQGTDPNGYLLVTINPDMPVVTPANYLLLK